jgi:hypothetical protein
VHAVSPAHGCPTFFTAGIRLPAPRPVGWRRDDAAVEADQPDLVGVVAQQPPSVPGAPVAALGDESQPSHVRVERDLVEGVGGVPAVIRLELVEKAAEPGADGAALDAR